MLIEFVNDEENNKRKLINRSMQNRATLTLTPLLLHPFNTQGHPSLPLVYSIGFPIDLYGEFLALKL